MMILGGFWWLYSQLGGWPVSVCVCVDDFFLILLIFKAIAKDIEEIKKSRKLVKETGWCYTICFY